MNGYEELGYIIRQKRVAKRMTMKELGDILGVKEVAVHQYESGKRKIPFLTLLKICKVLDINLDELQEKLERYV